MWGKVSSVVFGKPSADYYIDDKGTLMSSSRPRAGELIKYVPKGWGHEKWIANLKITVASTVS